MKNRVLQLIVLVSAVVLPAVAVPVVTAAPALAATCSGYGCDYTDPHVTQCDTSTNNTASGYITNGVGQRLAYVELRWSLVCHTNWGRISQAGQASSFNVYTSRPDPYAVTRTYYGPPGPVYADQLYGNDIYGNNIKVCAVGTAYDALNPQSPAYSLRICG